MFLSFLPCLPLCALENPNSGASCCSGTCGTNSLQRTDWVYISYNKPNSIPLLAESYFWLPNSSSSLTKSTNCSYQNSFRCSFTYCFSFFLSLSSIHSFSSSKNISLPFLSLPIPGFLFVSFIRKIRCIFSLSLSLKVGWVEIYKKKKKKIANQP